MAQGDECGVNEHILKVSTFCIIGCCGELVLAEPLLYYLS